jgi:hypothetical protein
MGTTIPVTNSEAGESSHGTAPSKSFGWPISLTAGLPTANICGRLAGEWELAQPSARRWMIVGPATLSCSIAILG